MTTLPYAVWQVSEDKELKLRLTSLQATKVEEKIGVNLLKVFMPAEGESFALPPLKVMLLLTHGALQKYEHGISFEDVSDLYDSYVDNGGDQAAFMADVVLPMLQVSGFMPREEKNKKKAPKKSKTKMEVVD
nr:MAG TPA: tail assembly chaperone [Caudoviricetes sp.]DAS24606.1 MAG TPA: tail assembly chaperone [Caudoviricetes sp.]